MCAGVYRTIDVECEDVAHSAQRERGLRSREAALEAMNWGYH